jgi:agmatinase
VTVAAEESLFGIATAEAPRVVVLGAPLDVSAGCRDGGGNGPAAVREASRALESYSPALDRDLAEVPFADRGDLRLPDEIPAALDTIEEAVDAVLAEDALPVLVGGEHTVSIGPVRALRRRHADLVLLHVDAHADLRSEYEGEIVSRATWIPHSGLGLDRVVQVGVRSMGADVGRGGARRTAHTGAALDAPRDKLAGPVYLSLDIDVLDPAAAPGVLCPEPGGPSFAEVLAFVHSLAGLDVVGLDVVEVAPDTDPGGLAALAAAKLLREAILLFA